MEIRSAVLEHSVDATLARRSEPAWDSLRHRQIISGSEEKFDLPFMEEEIFRLDSIGKFTDFLSVFKTGELAITTTQ